mmetsp:Transcript_27417/g.49383  ORF Transcript_27417/g.49383 Transcript_27417/m.49383 type:complete len:82 (-) Transcript_27417:176-421(-)
MEVKCVTLKNEEFLLYARPGTLVSELKDMLRDVIPSASYRMKLIHKGRLINDTQTLLDINYSSHERIVIMIPKHIPAEQSA